MANWQAVLKYDPLMPLLSAEDAAVEFFAARDLLGKIDKKPEVLWDLPEAQKIVKKQQQDGSWKYAGGNKNIRSIENYNQIETFRNLGYLVEMYGFNKSNPVAAKAADFLFNFQTNEGDIRGILGNQYTPYYTAGILELLIKAGYADDYRIKEAFKWLNSIRQNDGGWAIPLRTHNKKLDIISMNTKTLEPERSKPFSHLVTGIVLRAYAAHNIYRNSIEAKEAGKLLLSNLFKKDNYPDRGSPDFWLKFTFPFWFTDLISAMDTLSALGFSKDEPQIEEGVMWLAANQQKNGLWKLRILKNRRNDTDLWLSLAICRILKRLHA
jgi:squalene-hopene cyclase-like protein